MHKNLNSEWRTFYEKDNYLQDCATFHSASLGKDICYYKQIHRGWFLNSWQIDTITNMHKNLNSEWRTFYEKDYLY